MLYMVKMEKTGWHKVFEYLKIPYTHSGVISSYNAMNKVISKEIFKNHNIRSPNLLYVKKKVLIKKS